MDRDLDALWVGSDPVRLGERLRGARRRAKLTQEEMGRDIASVGYVSRLESGTRRGDLELFVRFAERLGIDVRELLRDPAPVSVEASGAAERAEPVEAVEAELRLRVDYAELALVSGDAAGAESGVADISDEVLVGLSEELVRTVRRVRAGAYEAQGRLAAAIAEGEVLCGVDRRDLAWIRDTIALSRCYRESGDIVRAISVGNRAAAEIDRVGLRGTTEAIQLVLTVAAAYSDRGDLVSATELCRDATARADALGSPVALASAYWNASVFEFEQGRVAEAIPLARRALSEFEKSEDSRNVGRLRGTLGVLLTQVEPPELGEAIALLHRSRAELEASSAGRYDLARSSWALARAHFQLGDREAADSALAQADGLVDEGAPLVLASVQVLHGQFAAADEQIDAARRHYRNAVLTLSAIGSDRSAGQLWYELAGLLEVVGDTEGALVAYKSAAASVGFAPRAQVGEHAPSDAPTGPA